MLVMLCQCLFVLGLWSSSPPLAVPVFVPVVVAKFVGHGCEFLVLVGVTVDVVASAAHSAQSNYLAVHRLLVAYVLQNRTLCAIHSLDFPANREETTTAATTTTTT